MTRTIRVSSRALGERKFVTVKVYDTLEEMRAAAVRFNGGDMTNTYGCVQAHMQPRRTHVVQSVIIRLARDYLTTAILVHEMHHATTALYGATLGDRISSARHLTHYNEEFAHLYSDMLNRLNDRLWALGYQS